MKTYKVLLTLNVLFVALLSGCSGKEPTNGSQPPVSAPVKLKVYGYSSSMTDSEFQKYFVEPVQQKFPNISFELITREGDVNTPEQILASGLNPDLLFVSNIYIGMFNSLGMTMDMSELAKKNKLGVDRFDAGAMEAIKQFGTKDQLYALPFSMNYGMTIYNKDIFDKFGISYPKDMMTWNETLELGKKLTRQDQATSYIGIDPGPVDQMKEQYSLPYVNDKQDKPMLNSDGYHKLFTLLKQYYEVPGFIGEQKKYDYNKNAFIKDRNLAMLPTWGNGVVGMLEDAAQQGQSLKWDLVTQPVFEDRPGIGRPANMPVLMVYPKSANKEAAFQVINTLVSEEVQTKLNKNGRLTVLKDEKIKKQFASELKSFQGKNIDAIFKLKQAPGIVLTDYDVELKKIVQNAAKDMAQNGKDVNTVLREAQDSAEKKLAQMKQK